MWCFSAILAKNLSHLPLFQVQFYVLAVGGIMTAAAVQSLGLWGTVHRPLKSWLGGILIVLFNQLGYFCAFKYAAPARVELMYYLWPILLTLLRWREMTLRATVGVLTGFLGIYVLMRAELGTVFFGGRAFIGYFLALISAISWASYTAYLPKKEGRSPYFLGLCAGGASLISLILHLNFEESAVLCSQDALFIFLAGSCPIGVGFFLWDKGVRFGNVRLLSVLTYFVPILSIGLLIIFGYSIASRVLFQSSTLVLLGTLMAAWRPRPKRLLGVQKL